MADVIGELLVRINAEDNASAVLAKISSQTSGLASAGAAGANGVNQVTQSANNLISTGGRIKEVGESIDKITKPLLVAGTAGAGALTAAAKASMDYETAFTGVKKTIDGTPEQMAKVNTELKNMSRTIPVSAVDLAHIAQIGGQLGVKANDISKFTRTIADMGVATNLAGEEGATTIARFMNVMGENIDNVDRVGSAIVHLGNNTATSEAEIATMAQRLGAYSATLGVSTADTLAYSAAMSSLGIEAEMGGSALGRTWLGIQSACVNGGAQLEAFAKYSGKSAEEFKKQWSTDPSGAFYGLLQGLSALDKDSLVSSFGKMGIENTRDIQALMKLVGGYELLGDCLQMSSKAYQENTALTKEATTAYGTTANKIQLAKNAVADAGRKWGDTLLPMITSGAEKVGKYADKLGGATEGQKKFTVKATAATLAMGAIGKATAGTVKYVGEFKDFITKLPPQLAIAAGGAAAVYAGVKLVTGAIHEAKNYKFTWGEGLAEQGEKIAAQSAKVKELAGFSKELGDLKLTINSDESSTEQIEAAKQRVQEIADILKEKYGLDITVDNSKIDETIQKLNSAIEKKTELEGSQTSLDISEGMLELANKKPEYEQGKATQHQILRLRSRIWKITETQ